MPPPRQAGDFTTRRLPTNLELRVPERGVESSVIAYLDDPSKQLDPRVWFNFDRLLFETGSATLKPQSQAQLKNMAEILKAYPSVKSKIGGYTDNTGHPVANLRLSQDRAANVRTRRNSGLELAGGQCFRTARHCEAMPSTLGLDLSRSKSRGRW